MRSINATAPVEIVESPPDCVSFLDCAETMPLKQRVQKTTDLIICTVIGMRTLGAGESYS